MRRLLTGLLIGVITALVPGMAPADNQKIANEIAAKLRTGGQLKDYEIGVKYQDGTAWLKGQVRNQEQMNAALKTVFEVPGVTRVVNGLKTRPAEPDKASSGRTTARFGRVESHRSGVGAAAANGIQPAANAIAPTEGGTAKWWQRMIHGAGRSGLKRRLASRPATGRAQRLTKSFNSSPVEPAVATLTQSVPKSVLPEKLVAVPRIRPPKPVSRTPSEAVAASHVTMAIPRTPSEAASPSHFTKAIPRIPSEPASPSRLTKAIPRIPSEAASPSHLTSAIPRTRAAKIPGRPIPVAHTQAVPTAAGGQETPGAWMPGSPIPAYVPGVGGGVAPARYDQPYLPNYAWPSYAAYPNYAALTYPRQYSPTAWPYIGPFYPYPQVPLGWRKVTLLWDDGWWMLDFEDAPTRCGTCCP